MAISGSKKGKSFMEFSTTSLLISVLLYFPLSCCLVLASDLSPSTTPVMETDNKNQNPFAESNFLDCEGKHQLQLEKLEELVKHLTELVSKLESGFSDSPVKVKSLHLSPSPDDELRDLKKFEENDNELHLHSQEEILNEEKGRVGSGSVAVLVTKYNAFWSERFQFISAVKLSSNPTCINVLPYKDFDGHNKYFAVGDDKGKLYIFMRTGDISLEFNTFLDPEESSPITSIVSFMLLYKNESMIATGHANGVVVMHHLWEVSNGEDWSSLNMERVGRFEIPEGSGSRIDILEVHYVGRKRYIMAIDGAGRITVFREDGNIYGTVTPSRRPVVFLKQRLLFLTETGAGSLDLRTMRLKESECEGLNGSFVKNYVFDAMDRSKAYGFTSEGDLIHTSLLGDAMNFKCRVRSKRSLDLDEPLALQAIKGYLLIANRDKIFVYNVSSQQYVRTGGLRLLFSAGLDEIISSFASQVNLNDGKKTLNPLITSDYEKLVIVSLGNGYVAMYRSNLPVFKNEFNSILWTSPVLFFILFLFGAWHFFANKKEALTSWGPDDPFNTSNASTTTGGSGPPGALDRSFSESSRNSEMMDLRGSGLRGPSRRYVSPPRYSGGAASSYRPSADSDPRPAPVDTRFRGGPSELKFRGANVDSGNVQIQKRRDSVFVNGQTSVDDSN